MRFTIDHTLTYRYSRPVFLEPQTIRLRPRDDGNQFVERFDLTIDPDPVGLTRTIDARNNVITYAWFGELTESLTIRSRSVVRTSRTNPFDYILDEDASSLPVTYPPTDRHLLDLALTRRPHPAGDDDRVAAFARRLIEESGGGTLAFLSLLTHQLYERTKFELRDEGDPNEPLQTFDQCRGACRDTAELFADACRVAGVAVRFVSGYQQGDPDTTDRHLHAWSEVYLPHAGWRGFDPTHGLAVSNGHVALAAAARPADAAPTTGNFRGTGATSQFSYELTIDIEW